MRKLDARAKDTIRAALDRLTVEIVEDRRPHKQVT